MVIPALVWMVLINIVPMFGIIMACVFTVCIVALAGQGNLPFQIHWTGKF